MTTVTVTTTGAGSFTIPTGVTSITVEAWGAGADSDSVGQAAGGCGGSYGKVTIPCTSGDILNWNVSANNVFSGTVNSTRFALNNSALNNNMWVAGNGTGSLAGNFSSAGSPVGTLVSSFSGGAGAAAQGGGGSRAGSGGGGGAGPDGIGLDGTAGAASTQGAGGAGDNGSGGAGGTTGAGVSNVLGGGGGAGGASGSPGNSGGAPGGGGGGPGRLSSSAGVGGRGQLRYTYTVAGPSLTIAGATSASVVTGSSTELVVNGDFSAGSANWTLMSGTVSGGSYTVSSGAELLRQNVGLQAGHTYRFQFDMGSAVGSSIRLGFRAANYEDSTNSGTVKSVTVGHYDLTFTVPGDTDGTLSIQASLAPYSGTIDNVSVKEVGPTVVLSPKTALAVSSAVSSALAGNVSLGGVGVSLTLANGVSASQASAPTLTPHVNTPLTIANAASASATIGQTYGGPDILGGAGDFTSATGWSLGGSGVAITGGQYIADGSNSALRQTTYDTGITAVVGKSYRILADLIVSGGSVAVSYAGASSGNVTTSGPVSVAAAATGVTRIAAVGIIANTTATVDNFRVYDNTYNVLLAFKWTLAMQGAVSGAQAGTVTLSPKTTLGPASAISGSATSNVSLTGVGLGAASVVSLSATGNVVLTPKTTLSIANAIGASLAGAVVLVSKYVLALNPATSASNTPSILLSLRGLGVDWPLSASITSTLNLNSHYALTASNAVSASQVSALVTTFHQPIVVAGGISASIASVLVLTAHIAPVALTVNGARSSSLTSAVTMSAYRIIFTRATKNSSTGAYNITNPGTAILMGDFGTVQQIAA